MAFTFRQLIYSLIFVTVVAAVFATCSRQVASPFLEKQPEFQEELVFQKTQEARIKANIEQMLEKLIGKKTFVVSVVSLLHDKQIEERVLEYDPTVVSANETTTLDDAFSQDVLSYSSLRPSITSIREEITNKSTLGLGFDAVTSTVIDLPGFPKQDKPIEFAEVESSPQSNASVDLGLKPARKLTLSSQEAVKKERVVMNERVVNSVISNKRINKVFVSVVIDEEYFSYLELSKEVVEELIVKASGVDMQRGDEVSVSFVPFLDKEFSWNHFMKKNKVWLDKVFALFEKLKPILFGVVVLAGVLLVVFVFKKLIALNKLRQERLKEEKLKQEQEEAELNKMDKITALEEKKQALMQLAQTKPDQFSTVLSSWIDVDEIDEAAIEASVAQGGQK